MGVQCKSSEIYSTAPEKRSGNLYYWNINGKTINGHGSGIANMTPEEAYEKAQRRIREAEEECTEIQNRLFHVLATPDS